MKSAGLPLCTVAGGLFPRSDDYLLPRIAILLGGLAVHVLGVIAPECIFLRGGVDR